MEAESRIARDGGPAWRIARLTSADAELYRSLRLHALRLHPAAFTSDFAEESQLGADTFAARMPQPPGVLFGAFVRDGQAAEQLVGGAGLTVQPRAKLRHKGVLVGVYVEAPHRRGGLARGLVEAVIAQARLAGLRVLQLRVTVGNAAARQLYAELGFQAYGVEPRALCVDGTFHDYELMALLLD